MLGFGELQWVARRTQEGVAMRLVFIPCRINFGFFPVAPNRAVERVLAREAVEEVRRAITRWMYRYDEFEE